MNGVCLLVLCALASVIFHATSHAEPVGGWAIWKHDANRPGQVAVARLGSLQAPWYVDGIWGSNARGAWKKACWLVRNGDITGKRYSSADMNAGRVSCNTNCNCKF